MSDCKQHPMQCPQCGAHDKFAVWSSVNTDITPHLKAQVISGELFQWKCPVCGHSWQVEYPMLYHDMSARVLIEFRPTPPNEKRDTRPNPMYAAFERMGYRIQYAYTLEELKKMASNIK